MELSVGGRDKAKEIHEIFSEGARFVEAAELDYPASDNFVLRNAEDRLGPHLLHGVNDSESHAHGQ